MAADSAEESVVILVHGIRDFALWQNEIRSALNKAGFIAEPVNYGRFNLIQFLTPIPYFRSWAVKQVWEDIRILKSTYPGVKLSFIAHSFGTYIISYLIRENFDLNANRIIFCGSVVSYGFRFQDFQDRFTRPILNEVGTRDVWPAIAESVTWGYGSAGTYGFRRPLVRDRWHNGAGHGFFLTSNFCTKFWVPFLKNGTLVEGAEHPERPRWWLRILSVIKAKYFVLAVLTYFLYSPATSLYDSVSSRISNSESAIRPWQTWPWAKPQAICLEPSEKFEAYSCGDPNGEYIVANAPWDDDDHGLKVRAGVGSSETQIQLFPPNLTQITRGECATEDGGTEWCKVSCKFKNVDGGYVATKFLKLRSEALSRVRGIDENKGLLVRNWPYLSCTQVGSIPYNATNIITHICETGTRGTSVWCLVTYGSLSGWVPSVALEHQKLQ
jgi:hypothetical protein